jgi:hypothetical protein
MKVYCLKDERGWLFREQPVPRISGVPEEDENALALMVYLAEEDALADAPPDGSGSVVEMRSPAVITEALEDGRFRYVRVRWGVDSEAGDTAEDTVCALPGWLALVEAFERAEEEAKRELANQAIVEMLDSGLVEYDAETDTLRRKQ